MNLSDVITSALDPALALLPDALDSAPARVALLSIGLQESRFQYRQQIGGPARGYWQFEQGTQQSRGGVWGIYLHDSSRYWLNEVCAAMGVPFDPVAIYGALDQNDVLACAVARLALFTDPARLPAVNDAAGSWALYQRVWRPGKPRPDTWAALHQLAVEAVQP